MNEEQLHLGRLQDAIKDELVKLQEKKRIKEREIGVIDKRIQEVKEAETFEEIGRSSW